MTKISLMISGIIAMLFGIDVYLGKAGNIIANLTNSSIFIVFGFIFIYYGCHTEFFIMIIRKNDVNLFHDFLFIYKLSGKFFSRIKFDQ